MSQPSPDQFDPISDSPTDSAPPEDRPLLTYVLAGANIVIYLLMALSSPLPFTEALMTMDSGTLLRWGAKFGPYVWEGEYWRVLTAVFLHGGLIHLFFNTWALLNIGPAVEYLYGHTKFAAIYLGAGILGNAVSLAFSDTLSIGASGAIFGIFGGLIYLAMRIPGREGRRLWLQLLIPLGYNVAYGFASPNIDNFAHLGGLAGGIALSYVLGLPFEHSRRREQYVQESRRANAAHRIFSALLIVAMAAIVVSSTRVPHEWYAHFQRGNTLFQHGAFARAAQEYAEAARLNSKRPEIQFNLALAYIKMGNIELARAALKKALAVSPGFQEARKLLLQLETVENLLPTKPERGSSPTVPPTTAPPGRDTI